MLEFFEMLDRCYLCSSAWFTPYTLSSWYLKFNSWVHDGNCFLHRDGFKNFDKIIPPNSYYICLDQWLLTEKGQNEQSKGIRFINEDDPLQRRISSTKDSIIANRIGNSAVEGVQFLTETRQIEKEFGVQGLFGYSARFLDFE